MINFKQTPQDYCKNIYILNRVSVYVRLQANYVYTKIMYRLNYLWDTQDNSTEKVLAVVRLHGGSPLITYKSSRGEREREWERERECSTSVHNWNQIDTWQGYAWHVCMKFLNLNDMCMYALFSCIISTLQQYFNYESEKSITHFVQNQIQKWK